MCIKNYATKHASDTWFHEIVKTSYKLLMHHDFVISFRAKSRSYDLLRRYRDTKRCKIFFVRFASLDVLSETTCMRSSQILIIIISRYLSWRRVHFEDVSYLLIIEFSLQHSIAYFALRYFAICYCWNRNSSFDITMIILNVQNLKLKFSSDFLQF